jgi:hypothetical protein
LPQINFSALKPPQTFGRFGELNILQLKSSANWTHRTPADLPFGISGIADDIEGYIQHAAQPDRHSIFYKF